VRGKWERRSEEDGGRWDGYEEWSTGVSEYTEQSGQVKEEFAQL
jgi:hypothetical protein